MKVRKFLRTTDLARAVGLSEQQVRNYELVGFLPKIARSPKGYRLYTPHHLQALQVSQSLIHAFSWQSASHIMKHIHEDSLEAALAVMDARNAELHQQRCELEETLRLLETTEPCCQPE